HRHRGRHRPQMIRSPGGRVPGASEGSRSDAREPTPEAAYTGPALPVLLPGGPPGAAPQEARPQGPSRLGVAASRGELGPVVGALPARPVPPHPGGAGRAGGHRGGVRGGGVDADRTSPVTGSRSRKKTGTPSRRMKAIQVRSSGSMHPAQPDIAG